MVPGWVGSTCLIDPVVMGPPIVWLASPQARGVHDERMVATRFGGWLRDRSAATAPGA